MKHGTGGEMRLFVRDDDVGALTDALRFFVETFAEREIPVSYQVIPARFTQEAADYMLDTWRRHPELIEFGQHGLTHEMTVRGRRTLREFGPERSAAEQKEVISQGLALLRTRLGGEPEIRTFTPPRHKYDGATVAAAAAAGHSVFSAAYYPSRHHQLAYRIGRVLGISSIRHHGISYHGRQRPEAAVTEVSIAVDVDDGITLLHRADETAAAISRAAARSDIVGLMFHHEIYKDPALRAELVAIADGLASLGRTRFARMRAIGEDLAQAAAGARQRRSPA
jgi:hypothetical protein